MGGLCQKQSNVANQQKQSKYQVQETKNVLHDDLEMTNAAPNLNSISDVLMNGGAPSNISYSLATCPSPEELAQRCWINKRGHVVRTWKKRYCVLDKSSLHYYTDPSPEPPFGKGLKGSVALLGAICDVEESQDGNQINVEIYGNYGEKDLLFSVDNNKEGQKFVRMLRWAIRKITLTMLVRNLKGIKSGKNKATKASSQDILNCKGWVENEQQIFQQCIMNLLRVQLYQFLTVTHTGSILIRPALMRLWTAFDDTYIPDIHTEGCHMGLAWHIANQKELNNQYDLQLKEDEQKIITFEDIIDMNYHPLDKAAMLYLKSKVTKFHPPNVLNPASNHEIDYGIVSLTTKSAHVLFILVVNIHDYYDAIISIQQIVLFLQARQKLSSSAVRTKEQESAQAMNTTSVAKALRLITHAVSESTATSSSAAFD